MINTAINNVTVLKPNSRYVQREPEDIW